MYKNPNLNIYQGIIQYLLDTTNYNLKRIAYLSNSSLKNIRSLYTFDEVQADIPTKLGLLRLFQMVLEMENKNGGVTQRIACLTPSEDNYSLNSTPKLQRM